MCELLSLFTSRTMAAAAAGSRGLLLYRRSKLVSRVRGMLAGFVALFCMARSGGDLAGAARILTHPWSVVGLRSLSYKYIGLTFLW